MNLIKTLENIFGIRQGWVEAAQIIRSSRVLQGGIQNLKGFSKIDEMLDDLLI